tara:strand:+ start:398 stop:679 length:282 start_codon:yes stop_codon:yes gene_type:complete
MTTSKFQPQDDNILSRIENILQGYMRGVTHIVNEMARIRKHHREDKNFIIDEMARQHKELIADNQSLFLEVQHQRQVMESLVHSYNLDQLNEN